MPNKKELTRKELYDLVWSKPLTTLALEFAYSDNGLRKICLKHNIPLPKSGYWSKIAFNKEVTKEKLPDGDDTAIITLYVREEGKESFNQPFSDTEKIKQDLLTKKDLSFVVPDKLTKPHKYVIATQAYIKQHRLRSKTRQWDMVIDTKDVLHVNASDHLLSRAFRFIDTLIKAMEGHGFQVTANNDIKIKIHDISYKLKLTEKNKRVKSESKYGWTTSDLVPTGDLSLKLDDIYTIKEWTDTKTKNLEDRILDILTWIEIKAKSDQEQKERSRIWHKKQMKIQRKKEKLQKKKDRELENFEKLFQTATRWHKSQYIRNYIKEFKEFNNKQNTLDTEKEEWIKWAEEKADWYDPFIEKKVKLLKDIDRETLKPKHTRYW
jgi:hypothetical protein